MGSTSDTLQISTSGITANIATDYVSSGGITGHYQMIKLAYGVDGVATMVNSSYPLPVTVGGGLTATVSGFTGTIKVEGGGSTPVTVSGTVSVTGLTASPVYVATHTGSRVEITGGIPLSKTTDSISVHGPGGITYIYAHLVDNKGSSLSYTNGALNVNISGATISATIPSTVTVVGLSGATAVAVTVGNTVGINDTNILTGMTNIYGQVVGLRTDFTALGVGRPTAFKTGRKSMTSSAVVQMDSAGYTCTAGINIKALSTNTDFVYIGNTSGLLGSSFGHALDPGENVFLDIQNTDKIYSISNTGTQVITFIAS